MKKKLRYFYDNPAELICVGLIICFLAPFQMIFLGQTELPVYTFFVAIISFGFMCIGFGTFKSYWDYAQLQKKIRENRQKELEKQIQWNNRNS